MDGKDNMSAQFELSQLKHILVKLGEFFEVKLIVGYLFVFLSQIMDGSQQVIATIFVLLALDTLTGSYIAIKNKTFSSRGLYRGPLKFTVYFIFILVSRLVDKNIPLPFASPIIDCFLVCTEGYSIFENFAKLGFAAPTGLIERLKSLASNKKSE